MERSERLFQHLAFILHDGEIVYPIRKTNRDTWKRTFRIGLASNAQDDILELEDERELVAFVMQRRCAVRCASSDGSRQGLFSADHHQVRSLVVPDVDRHD